MKHHLARTLLYGIGAGVFLFLLITLGNGPFILFLLLSFLLIVAFLATEILPRANSATPVAKAKRQDKITVFTPLALTGIVLPVIIMFFDPENWGTGGTDYRWTNGIMLMLCGGPLILIYVLSLLRVLAMVTRRQPEVVGQKADEPQANNTPIFSPSSEKEVVKQKPDDVQGDNTPIPLSPPRKAIDNYGLRLLMMFGVVILGCITLFVVSILITNITTPELYSIPTVIFFLIIMGVLSLGIFKLIQMLRK